MKKQMGIVLIIIGAILIICGFFFTFSGNEKSENQNTETFANNIEVSSSAPSIKDSQTSQPTKKIPSKDTEYYESDNSLETDAKQKGNDFEGYMADILKANGMRIKEWNQGTTSPEGAYADNELNPDFRVVDKDKNLEYWVECKFRSYLPEKGFSLKESQLIRYNQIQGKSKKKVLIALGVGDTAEAPDHFYIIPVDTLVQYKYVGPKFLPNYSINNPRNHFKQHVRDWFYEEVFKKKK